MNKIFYKFTNNYSPILNKEVCSLCGIEFDKDDPLLEVRKQKHEQWHSHSTYFGRASMNFIKGVPTWI